EGPVVLVPHHLRDAALLLVRVVDRRAVLRTHIVPLAHPLRRVVLLEERLQQRLVRHLRRVERHKYRLRVPCPPRADLLVSRVRRIPARVPDRRRVHARHLPEQPLGAPEATQREHCRLDPVRERRHQRRPEHLVPLRYLERPILPSRQRLFRRNHLHITLEQLHGQYLRHFYDTTSLLRSPSNRRLFVPRSPAFAPRPSLPGLRSPAF